MSDSFKRYQAGIAKILAQPLGGMKIDCAIFCSPHQQSRIVANFWQRAFHFRQIRRPIFYDLQSMMVAMIFNDWDTVSGGGTGGNFGSVSKHPAQRNLMERGPARGGGPKHERAESTADKKRKALAMLRPGIDGRHQN